jgi:hypothetical protein
MFYLPLGVLLPRPPPDGLPVVLGPFGGVFLLILSIPLILIRIIFIRPLL